MTNGTTGSGWPRIGVMGAGGIGCYFAGMLARAGAPVTVIARPRHAEAIARDGLRLESLTFDERVPMAASSDPAALSGAAIVLVSVKTVDTEEAARQMRPHLAAGAVVISLQNGLDNAGRLRALVTNAVFPGVVYAAAEMAGPGHVKHNGGNMILTGDDLDADGGRRGLLEGAAAVLARAGIDCRVSADVRADLWGKLASNCSYNAVSALARATCGRMTADPATRGVMRRVMEEVVAVAAAEGLTLDLEAMVAHVLRVGQLAPNAVSSTFQDIAAGRRTEIDDLNGAIVRRGAERGIDTPVNGTLYALVKMLESAAR
ncbi:MAG TPA: 2-dehydropantoate 2-reductase [Vicinamibacterales bacterium]|nr:2-dehydropantoate 2-reductase [Vicinamibacterales bacterium]